MAEELRTKTEMLNENNEYQSNQLPKSVSKENQSPKFKFR